MVAPTCMLPLVLVLSDLSGIWEIQTLGSDRIVRIETSDQKVAVHRVLYPEFEGKKYRLDHLYRGTINAGVITGQLWVKDNELPEFEALRSFKGTFTDGTLVIDGMPLQKKPDASGNEVAMLPTAIRSEESPDKGKRKKRKRRRRGVQSGKTTKKQKALPTTIAESEDTGSELYDQILGGGGTNPDSMFNVSREIDAPNDGEDAFQDGRRFFENADYRSALEAFERAKTLGAGARAERYRGLCLSALGRYEEAKAPLKRALRIDPNDSEVRAAYENALSR